MDFDKYKNSTPCPDRPNRPALPGRKSEIRDLNSQELRQYADALKGYVRTCGNAGIEYDSSLDSAVSMIRNLSAIATDAIRYQWTLDGDLIISISADHYQEFEEIGLTELIHELGELGKRELAKPVMVEGYIINELPAETGFAPTIFVSTN